MKKQYILAAIGVVLVALLYFGTSISLPKKPGPVAQPAVISAFDAESKINALKATLTPSQSLYVSKLENGITRGDVQKQQVTALYALADFWKDSAQAFVPYGYYLSKAVQLDNSEKNLTFAARIFLEQLRAEQDPAAMQWETGEAIRLFEEAIKVNPSNDSLRVGLGSAYIFGKGRNGDPQETMKGIQELLGVVRKDSNNMQAQLALGIGGYVSGQYDKAIDRLQKVIAREPNNLEAVAFLADTYAAKGNKTEAVRWYTLSKRLANNPHYSTEVDERIKSLR